MDDENQLKEGDGGAIQSHMEQYSPIASRRVGRIEGSFWPTQHFAASYRRALYSGMHKGQHSRYTGRTFVLAVVQSALLENLFLTTGEGQWPRLVLQVSITLQSQGIYQDSRLHTIYGGWVL